MNSVKNHIADIKLELLPAYADFLLKAKKEEFVQTLLSNSHEVEVPILKYFQLMSPEAIFRLSLESNVKFLSALRDQTFTHYIDTSVRNWVTNQLPIVTRDQVIVEDITLISYVRRKTFREMIHYYTKDPAKTVAILDEIDRFLLAVDSILFKTFIGIQKEQLNVANEALKKREQELLDAQSVARTGSFEWDLTGAHKSSFTPEVFKIFEFDQTSTLELFIQDVHPEDRLKLRGAIERAMHDGFYECEYRYNRNNKAKILYSRGNVIFDEDRPVRMIGTVTDITEKAYLIQKLRESEGLGKQAQALTNTGNWKWSTMSDIIEWSDEMYRIYGLEPQSEIITFERFVSFIHEDDRSRRIAEITSAMQTGKASDYIMRIDARDGKTKVLRGKGEILLDKEGKSVGMLGTCQDITNEFNLTAQLKAKNEELLRKNRDLESFNFIASHDLQEPLRKIQLYSNRIMDEGIDQIPQHLMLYFNKISMASHRMQKMIEDFLIFYHSINTAENVERIDLNFLLNEIKEELKDVIDRKGAVFKIEYLLPFTGMKPHIKQLFRHLISNALKFSHEKRTPDIRITSEKKPGQGGNIFLEISIHDNGIGFDPKYTERIFELFQKLHSKDQYSGSGIGLSLCKKIAEDHGGWISARSDNDSGSVFTVYLPYKA